MTEGSAVEPAKTLAREVAYEGIGLHTGVRARLRIKPAPAGSGVRFCRTDAGEKSPSPALITLETDLSRRSSLRTSAGQVETVEHLLAAISALRLDDVDVEIDGPEVPGGDGSARVRRARGRPTAARPRHRTRVPWRIPGSSRVAEATAV